MPPYQDAAANAAKAMDAAKQTASKMLFKEDGSVSVTSIVLQVIAGFILSLVIYWISLYIMRADKLVIDGKLSTARPQEVQIVNGFVDCAAFANKVYNTTNELAANYMPLPRSVNRKGGAQFTYSFWMYMTNIAEDNVRGKVILSRGSMSPYRYIRSKVTDTTANMSKATDMYLRCPLIRFGNSYKELVVEFNTVDDPEQRIVIMNRQDTGDSALRRNMASLSANYWVLMTFVFEDNVPINDFENGVVLKYYVNDTMYQVSRVRSTLRQNNGSLNLFPLKTGEPPIAGARMASFSYFNYALTDEDIAARYLRGPSRTPNVDSSSRFGVPLYLSASNRVDATNM